MATYTKETALYDTGAIAQDIQEAGNQVNKYITAIGDDGIKVHPYNSTTGTADTKNYTKIDSNGLEVYQQNHQIVGQNTSEMVAKFTGDGAQIGQSNKQHIDLDSNSFQLIDTFGNSYVVFRDLWSTVAGGAAIVDQFIGNGITSVFDLSCEAVDTDYIVNVDGEDIESNIITKTTTRIVFSSGHTPNADSVIKVWYITQDHNTKYYTLGSRVDGSTCGPLSLANGLNVTASGSLSHAEGDSTVASGICSHAEGHLSVASGAMSHAEGCEYVLPDGQIIATEAKAKGAHAEGIGSVASGEASHAEGRTAFVMRGANYGHAEGENTTVNNTAGHAEGSVTSVSGKYGHSEGIATHANGQASHSEGSTSYANGNFSHAQNSGTIANSMSQTTLGEYNIEDTKGDEWTRGTYAVIIGNGEYKARSNALTVAWDGTVDIASGAKYKIGGVSLADIFYPVGSYYETSDSSFDPNTAWGGTWVLEAEGSVHVSAGSTYTVGSSYGSNTHTHTTSGHTLTTNEIPAHTHGSKTVSYDFRVTQGTGAALVYAGTNSSISSNSNKAQPASSASGTFSTHQVNLSASHTHNSVGGGNSHSHGDTGSANSWQPSIAVNRWHRTA